MGKRVIHSVAGKFTLDGGIGTAQPCTQRISSLNHKAVDDAVKRQSVIEAGLRQRQKILDGNGGVRRVEFH